MAEIDGEKIYEKLDAIDSKVDALLLWKVEHVESHKLVERDLQDMRTIIFDDPNLKSKVERLWNCKKNITRWREFWLWILRYLILTGIIGLVTWLLMLYKRQF